MAADTKQRSPDTEWGPAVIEHSRKAKDNVGGLPKAHNQIPSSAILSEVIGSSKERSCISTLLRTNLWKHLLLSTGLHSEPKEISPLT